MLTSLLGWNFFGLSSEYRKHIIDEFDILAQHRNISYSDFMILPTYIRKYLINKLFEEASARKAQN